MKPSKQTHLYGLEKYFNEITNLYDLQKMPNKIIFSGKKGIGKATTAYHIINYVLSNYEKDKYDQKNFTINDNNRSYKLLNNGSHPNFFLIDIIDEKKNIEINQIRQMINYTNKSSFNEQPRFVLIDNVEYLNKSSANALLKIIEEPNFNIFFILISNSNKSVLSTLESRCLKYKFNLSFKETLNISNKLLEGDILDLINIDLLNYYNTPGDFLNLINFSKEKKLDLINTKLIDFLYLIIDCGYYKKDKLIKNIILNYIELYFLKSYKFSYTKNNIFNRYKSFITKVNNVKNFNLDEESLFMEFKNKIILNG